MVMIQALPAINDSIKAYLVLSCGFGLSGCLLDKAGNVDILLKHYAFHYNMRGQLMRAKHVADGTSLSYMGENIADIIFERHLHYPTAIRVSVRRKDSSKKRYISSQIYDILLEKEVYVPGFPGVKVFYGGPQSGNRANIGFIAPGLEMTRIEYYDDFVNKYFVLRKGPGLSFRNKDRSFSLLVKKVWRYSALVDVEEIDGVKESIIKHMRTGFFDGVEVGISKYHKSSNGAIRFHCCVKPDYSVTQVKSTPKIYIRDDSLFLRWGKV